MSDFHDQPSAGIQVRGGFIQDSPHQIQTIVAAGQRHYGFMAEFRRQCTHGADPDIGRIAQDEVVTPILQCAEQI